MFDLMLADAANVCFAFVIWAALSITQGTVVGYLTDAFRFRSLGLSKQLALAPLLFISVSPCVFNCIALIGGVKALLGVSALLLLSFLLVLAKNKRRYGKALNNLPRYIAINRFALAVSICWSVLSLIMLIDFQSGSRIFESLTMVDNSSKIGIADCMARTGIPPANSTFYPGHYAPTFYHYYWTMLCELVAAIFGSAHNTRAAVIAGIMWAGILLFNLCALAGAYFKTASVSTRRVVQWCIALPVVANFYVLVSLPMNLLALFMKIKPLKSGASICWWTADPVYPLMHSLFWVPHHICGLIAGYLASMFLLEASRPYAMKYRIVMALVGSACLSSCMGLSAYIGLGFAVAWSIWALISLCKRDKDAFITTVATSLSGAVLTIPFLQEMLGGAKGAAGLTVAVRRFELLDWFLPPLHHAAKFLHQLAYLAVLPVNYLFGFGFVMLGAVFFLNWQRSQKASLQQKDLFLLVLTVTSIILGTFLRSRFNGNDFGWRVMMPANISFLIWTAQYLVIVRQQKLALQFVCKAAIALGLATSVYALYLDRVSLNNYLDPQFSYDRRIVYEKLDKDLPLNAVVQHNPRLTSFATEMYAILYSHRQVVSAERALGDVINGLDYKAYLEVVDNLERLYANPSLEDAKRICGLYGINVLIVKEGDPIWSREDSWLANFPVIASSRHVKAYLIRPI